MFIYTATLTLHETFYILNETTEIKDNFYLPKEITIYTFSFGVMQYRTLSCSLSHVLLLSPY